MALMSRISSRSDDIIQELTQVTGKTKVEIIEAALETYRHYERMRLLNESYQKLRDNEKEWNAELEERKILEGTLNDGLEEE